MQRFLVFFIAGLLAGPWQAQAQSWSSSAGGQRIQSRYCTIIVESGIDIKKLNKRVSTRWIRSKIKVDRKASPARQLASKCDTLFRRAEELLDMYPPGIHVTIRIVKGLDPLKQVHHAHYGRGTEAIAFYIFKNNTIYIAEKKLSESVLAHEMAHCIIDHFFKIRPPRKIEELLAMHVDAELRN